MDSVEGIWGNELMVRWMDRCTRTVILDWRCAYIK